MGTETLDREKMLARLHALPFCMYLTALPSEGSAVDTWHFANLDHVVSAHEIHDDPARFLAGLDGKELANASPNFRFTSEALNKRMSDSSIPDFIKKVEENPAAINWNGVDGAPMPDEVKQALLDANKQARADIDGKICTAYYSSTAFAFDAATAAAQRGIEMGARQALGFVFLEIWFACKKEIQAVPAGGDFGDTVKAVIRGIPLGLDNARKKYKYLISQSYSKAEQKTITNAAKLAYVLKDLCEVVPATKSEKEDTLSPLNEKGVKQALKEVDKQLKSYAESI